MKPIEIEWLGRAEYAQTLDLQNQLVGEYLAAAGSEKLLLLEHEPVYTIGRTRDQSSLRSPQTLPHPVFEINRGGKATWHGPGQLVAYPIIDLMRHGRDLHSYMRFLEEVIIATCRAFGVESGRREGLTGVWVGPRKIASIGVGVRRWVTMHGLALNVTRSSLESFQHITPCGIADVEMTCLERESGRAIEVEEAAKILAGIFLQELPALQADNFEQTASSRPPSLESNSNQP
ncbi:MAG TPA: lipoyl(octanoyl) transferase LipB [Terrimicrobiaceae bacterium]|nr:lipoyl(octanoyl) transferase LipB [Terrimicrobiaceae bacterium]